MPHRPASPAAALVMSAGLVATAQTIRVGPVLQDASPTQMWVMWETEGAGTNSAVEYGIAPGAGLVAPAVSIPSVNGNEIHHALLDGLEPDTVYNYRVRTDGALSPIARFRTPATSAAERPFRFVAYSDMQGNGAEPTKHAEIVNDGIIGFVSDHFGPNLWDELAFVIIPGDLVSTGGNYAHWRDHFFEESKNLSRHVPLYPVAGNHDYFSGPDAPAGGELYYRYFKLPENGTPGFEERWWFKDHGNVRIIGLDSNSPSRVQAQLDWLDGVLDDAAADPAIDFVFAQLHHPFLSEAWTPGNTAYTGDVVRRLEAFSTSTGKPSAHFFGHTHAYSRGQSRDHTHLWVNVATGEGSIDYWGAFPNADYDEFQRTFVDWGFVLLEVTAGDNPSLRLRRVSRGNPFEPRDNEVMDDLTIRRYAAGPATPATVAPSGLATPADPDAVTLDAGAFEEFEGDTHLESHFQVTATPGDWSSPVERWIRIENLYRPADAAGASTGFFSVDTVTDRDITRTTLGGLAPAAVHQWRVRYRDSGLSWSDWSEPATFRTGGAVRVTLFAEGFEDVPLGPPIDEGLAGGAVWTDTSPPGWTLDDSGVPGVGDPSVGVREWEGWAFADRAWWTATAGDQGRSGFTGGDGPTVAVADPDEWDDRGRPETLGDYSATMTTPAIDLTALRPGTGRVAFWSSWRPEDRQRVTIEAAFDDGSSRTLLDWRSEAGPLFKGDATNERVELHLDAPIGARSVTLTFGMFEARNDWWWAIDDVTLTGECASDIVEPAGVLDIFDVLGFFDAFASGSPIADLAGPAGSFDIFDVVAFFAAFGVGCP